MVVINPPPPALAAESLSLFHATDELLSATPTLVFYGASATTTALPTNSRIQIHIYSAAGFHSFPRLTVSPNSPLYTAVACLAREEQGDDICRGLAFSIYKYFTELPENVKNVWSQQFGSAAKLPSAPELFSDAHAAILASRMNKVENIAEVLEDVKQTLAQQTLSWIDVDVVLPPGSMRPLSNLRESGSVEEPADSITDQRYARYAPIVKLFGDSSFLPTSKLRRAPSRPTAANRSITFSKRQKENLRREMNELLETEESYVGKIYDLLHSVAEDFRLKARKKSSSSTSPSEQALQGLFPPSLDQILQINSAFLDALRAVLDATEDQAIDDLNSTDEDEALIFQPTENDVTGAVMLASCLSEWFPKFSDCYSQYIQAHSNFSRFLRVFLKETGSSFSRRLQETGEQRLMSMLIEPVQRLPRYNLYIDNIVKQLPVRHPALRQLMKARDMISEICSQDASGTEQVKLVSNLRLLVPSMPNDVQPLGRFITAVDVTELAPPYRGLYQGSKAQPGILLLFSDCIVELRKTSRRATNARSLTSELDGSRLKEASSEPSPPDLIFHQCVNIDDVFISEVDEGRMMQLSSVNTMSASSNHATIRMFNLSLHYEGRAAKFVEEFVKARVEGRFSESERDSHAWEAREVGGDLSLFSAIFEEVSDHAPTRRGRALIRVVVDADKHQIRSRPGDAETELVVSVAPLEDGTYLVEAAGINDYMTRDRLTASEFLPVFTKRLGNFLQMRNQIKNPRMTASLLRRNRLTLTSFNAICPMLEPEEVRDRGGRPASPVKLLSNLFSSGSLKETSSPRKAKLTPMLSEGPRLQPTMSSRPQSRDDDLAPRPQSSGKLMTDPATPVPAVDTGIKLEETMFAYLLALHSRKGNVVGRNLRARATAQELHINEVYNSLLEDPSNLQVAAQTSVDVLFAAFEKFVRVAWTSEMGPIISYSTLISVQSKSDSSHPGEFVDFFRKVHGELSPPNQRALQGIIKLLADLLSGTGNDSDRGTLTASFAEAVIAEGNSHDFISLFDRFVEDSDVLFGLVVLQTPNQGSMGSRYRSVANTPSIGSNASSLRKKFGFGTLSRENSRNDHESKFGAVLRTLSKTKNVDGDTSISTPRNPALVRSNSTDFDGRISPNRPKSRDRPTVLGAFAWEDDVSHSGRNFLQSSNLDPIGEVPQSAEHPPKKKRRSSLSDLKPLHMSAHNTPTWSPATPRRPGHARQMSASPLTGKPSRSTLIPSPLAVTPAVTPTVPRALPVPSRKENHGHDRLSRQASPGTLPQISPGTLRRVSPTKSAANVAADEVTITSRAPVRRRKESASGIPMLKSPAISSNHPVLSERVSSGNVPKLPLSSAAKTPGTPSTTAPRKLRMQSPQKLRERLLKEQKAIASASTDLQAELSKIGDEIANSAIAPNATGSVRASRSNTVQTPARSATTHMGSSTASLVGRVTSLESKLSAMSTELTNRTTSIESDLRSSLIVSETRARKLDELYKEANAENEALYGKFNSELARIVSRVRGGEGVDELKALVKQNQEELAVLKKENGRLKRENVGLRAQLKE